MSGPKNDFQFAYSSYKGSFDKIYEGVLRAEDLLENTEFFSLLEQGRRPGDLASYMQFHQKEIDRGTLARAMLLAMCRYYEEELEDVRELQIKRKLAAIAAALVALEEYREEREKDREEAWDELEQDKQEAEEKKIRAKVEELREKLLSDQNLDLDEPTKKEFGNLLDNNAIIMIVKIIMLNPELHTRFDKSFKM